MLSIQASLDALKAALATSNAVVLVAPPGAGKTTVAPPALLGEPWAAGGRLIVLEPRRVAARAAAARMAASLGEAVGETVGYRVRMDSRVGARTRLEVVTEGVFTRMILDDPALEGVAAVLFDEFHERSLEGDLGLALARDAQTVLRPDLRLLVMSATLDGAAVGARLGDAPLVESRGRAFPVETIHLGRDGAGDLVDAAARAVRRALGEQAGDILVFLPGQGEIRRVAAALERLDAARFTVTPLHGGLGPAEQDRALAPAEGGRRKVVLATAIAETSLTIPGVRVVIDAGLSREPRFEPSSGLTRLVTVRVSRAAADQRRGRAGREALGVCYRLWDEAETRSLAPYRRPEILEADLSGFALQLAAWGARDAAGLMFFDAPPAAAMAEARALLRALGAIGDDGAITAAGRALARLPLPPRLARMVQTGAEIGAGRTAARVAALLSEPRLGGAAVDLEARLQGLLHDRRPAARDAERLAERWARAAGGKADGDAGGADVLGRLILAAYPERLAQRAGAPGVFRLRSGRGVVMDAAEPLAQARWLAVADVAGEQGGRDRIRLAAAVDETDVLAAFAGEIVTATTAKVENGRVRAREVRRLDKLVIDSRDLGPPPAAVVREALLDAVRREGLSALPLSAPGPAALRARIAFARTLDGEAWPDLSDAALMATLDGWLAEPVERLGSLAVLAPADIEVALASLLPPDGRRRLERLAPPRFLAPTGTAVEIDYDAPGGPTATVRVQELFGLDRHPTVGEGRTPLLLTLTSPARRPIQLTRDLPGFWRGAWAQVRKEMRGRYPKHAWPENPLSAVATTRAKAM